MRPSLELLEKIDLYLQGQLSPEETSAFDQERTTDPELNQLIGQQQLLQQAIARKALLAQVVRHAPGGGGSWIQLYRWPLSVLIAGIAIALVVVYGPWQSETTRSRIATVQPRQLFSGDVANETIAPTCGHQTFSCFPSALFDLKPEATAIPDLDLPGFIPPRVGGLQPWVSPITQYFTINPDVTSTIECAEGTLIILPKAGLRHADGRPVKGSVELEVIEALTIDKMIAYNLITMAGKRPLSSGGMLYIQPRQGDELLNFAEDTPCHVEVPTDTYNPDMMAWEGVPQADGKLDWQQPQALERFLVPVDFRTLDFVPEGFRPKFRSLLPFEGMQTSTPEREDSMYYALTTTTSGPQTPVAPKNTSESSPKEIPIKVKNSKVSDYATVQIDGIPEAKKQLLAGAEATLTFDGGVQKRSVGANGKIQFDVPDKTMAGLTIHFVGCDPYSCDLRLDQGKIVFLTIKESDLNCLGVTSTFSGGCYIDPASVKALRQPAFEKTYLATREFEERLQALHRIPNAQPYLDLYVKNIKKDLYLTDEMVAQSLSGKDKAIFEQFAAQQLTNVQNAHAFSDELQAFYNQKRKEFRKLEEKKELALQQESTQKLRLLQKQLTELQTLYASPTPVTAAKSKRAPVTRPALLTSPPPPSVATQSNYKFSWVKTGWVNLDCFLHELQNGEHVVAIQTGERKQPKSIYQCVNMLKTVIGINPEETGYNGHYPAATSRFRPSFESTYCIGIDRAEDGRIHYAETFFNPYLVSSVSLRWEPVSEEELLERLKSCSTQNLHLINDLKKQAERVRQELAIREKEAAIQAEQKRLQEKALKKAAFIRELTDHIDPCKQNIDDSEKTEQPQAGNSASENATPGSQPRRSFPDIYASFPGGETTLSVFIAQHMRYPKKALEQNISGMIRVFFTVDENGTILNPYIYDPQPETALLEEEAIRIVRQMPPWIPAEKDGKPCASEAGVPINFAIR